jgi:hypothetical protein
MKKLLIYGAVYVVNVMVHIGAAGLIATGFYLLNSYFGWAVDAPAWRYGLVGLLYLALNLPFVWKEANLKAEDWMYLF